MTLTFGSLFSGIGGFDLGLERAGMECLWQVEIDDYCQQILEKHWPDVAKYRDVYGVSGSTLEAVDVICGGFPCQPVSLAGRRQGTDDERWLWPEYARLVGEIRPRYVIVENVPGLRTKGGYEVVADLAEMGYHFEWGALSAEAVGAPHKRERFILVAYSGSKRRQQNTRSPHANESEYAWGSEEDDYQPERDGESYRAGEISRDVAYSDSERLEGCWGERELGELSREGSIGWRGSFEGSSDHWLIEPNVGRVADGVPNRVERIRSLGNAIVPQVAEVVGRWVVEHEREMADAAT